MRVLCNMKNVAKSFITLILFCMIIGCTSAGEDSLDSKGTQIPACVNPAIELISTIHYLARTGQYDEMLLPGYMQRVEDHFGRSRVHSAVRLAKEMNRLNDINGSAPMALAVYLGPPPLLEPINDLSSPPGDLDPRWTPKLIDDFLEEARKFAKETNFMDFFTSQKDFHAMAVENLKKTLKKENILPWFNDFFGTSPKNYKMYIGLINGSCNYGFSVTHQNGEQDFISLLGARWPDKKGVPRYPKEWFMPVVIHEYCHSYINPLINNNPGDLKELGEALFVYHREKMIKHGYNTWNVLLFEYIVRACTIRYLLVKKGKKTALQMIAYDEKVGFPAIKGLVELFDTYESNRTKYPNIESFMPDIKKYFESCLIEMKMRKT